MNRGTIRVSTPPTFFGTFPGSRTACRRFLSSAWCCFLWDVGSADRHNGVPMIPVGRPPAPVLCFLRPRSQWITDGSLWWITVKSLNRTIASWSWFLSFKHLTQPTAQWTGIWVSRNLKWKYVDSCDIDMSGKSIRSWWKIWKIWWAELWWFFSFLPSPSRSFVAARLPKPATSRCGAIFFFARNRMET